MIDQMKWLGHDTFFIPSTETTPSLYINPWRLSSSAPPADLILITDTRFDHCSPADIAKISLPHTRLIGTTAVADQLDGCMVLRPWQLAAFDRMSVKAIPNGDSRDDSAGFVVSVNYYDIYFVGDCQNIPEGLRPDIVIVPISGSLSVDAAADMVQRLRPQWAVPCRWGRGVASASRVEAQLFARTVGDAAQVVLMPLE